MSLIIRDALLTDVDEISIFEQKCFSSPWGKMTLFNEILSDNSTYLVIVREGEIIAFGGYQNIVGQGHITTMAVKEEYRNKKIGSLLLSTLINQARKEKIFDMTLEVRRSNFKAIKLYEKFDFKIYGKRKEYYSDNKEDAYIMWRFSDELEEV